MKAIVSLDTKTEWWKPLTTSPYFLTVRNVSILENQIFFLKELGIKDVLILKDGNHSLEIESFLESGDKWSMNIRYAPLVDQFSLDYDIYFSSFLDGCKFVLIEGLIFFSKSSLESHCYSNGYFEKSNLVGATFIDSFKQLYDLNLKDDFHVDFTKFNFTTNSSNDLVGLNVILEEGSFIDNKSYVADHSIVQKGSRIENSIIASSCVVGKNCNLNNSIVYPGTVINDNLNFDNMLISKQFIYNRDIDSYFYLDDDNIISGHQPSRSFSASLDKLFALVFVTLLFVPYFLVIHFFRFLYGEPLKKENLYNDKSLVFTTCNSHILSNFLNLFEIFWFILRGEMALVGIVLKDKSLLSHHPQIPLALISFYPIEDELELKEFHCLYFLSFKTPISKYSNILKFKQWSVARE